MSYLPFIEVDSAVTDPQQVVHDSFWLLPVQLEQGTSLIQEHLISLRIAIIML